MNWRAVILFAAVLGLFVMLGFTASWRYALTVLNMGLVSAIMALGVNMQWGYAGLFNVGVMGFVALGGMSVVLVSMPPVTEAWAAGGARVWFALAVGAGVIAGAIALYRRLAGRWRGLIVTAWLIAGYFVFRWLFDPAVEAIEAVNPTLQGYLGGLGLPVLLAWPVGGLIAAGAAWLVAKTALGLRSDYLAIATLGIAEIIIAVMKNEGWLTRGVKNVNGLPRPVPNEIDLQQSPEFVERAAGWGADPVAASAVVVDLGYLALFAGVLAVVLLGAELALRSPWGRMMRAIRDNETAAEAMGKDVKKRHLQIFVIGAAICGLAGAMMTTMDGLLAPTFYQPLRFTFLIWVMVIVGGSGNNWGAVLGALLVWLLWVEVENRGPQLMSFATAWLSEGPLKAHLIDSAAHLRLPLMGVLMLVVLRFSPRGLIPEK